MLSNIYISENRESLFEDHSIKDFFPIYSCRLLPRKHTIQIKVFYHYHKRLLEILSDGYDPYNTMRLYFLLMIFDTEKNKVNVPEVDLSKIIFDTKDIHRLNKSLNSLYSHKLLNKTGHRFKEGKKWNTYQVFGFQNDFSNEFKGNKFYKKLYCIEFNIFNFNNDILNYIYYFNDLNDYNDRYSIQSIHPYLHINVDFELNSLNTNRVLTSLENKLNVDFEPKSLNTNRVLMSLENTDSLLNRYSEIYTVLPNGSKKYCKPAVLKSGRIFSDFHSIKRNDRKNLFWDGEHIVELFDAHNMMFCLLSKLVIDKYGENEETLRFRDLVLSGRFYETIQEYLISKGYDFDRNTVKQMLQQYRSLTFDKKLFNIDGSYNKIYRGMIFDEYFNNNFPTVRNYILGSSSHTVTKKTKYSFVEIESKVSDLHEELFGLETEIISKKLIVDIEKIYKVKSISLHDAVYIKESDSKNLDYDTVNEMFKRYITE